MAETNDNSAQRFEELRRESPLTAERLCAFLNSSPADARVPLRACREIIARHVTSGGTQDFSAAEARFAAIDADHNQYIDAQELRSALQRSGISSADAHAMIEAADVSEDDRIDFAEFLLVEESAVMQQRRRQRQQQKVEEELVAEAAAAAVDSEAELRSVLDFWSSSVNEGQHVWQLWQEAEQPRSDAAWALLVAGAVGGAVSKTATAPLSRLSILLQVDESGARSLRSTYKEMTAVGLRGLWVGNVATVLKIAPSAAVNLMTYEKLKATMIERGIEAGTAQQLFCGAMSGIISLTSTYPLDILRTHISINTGAEKSTFLGTTRKLIAEGGVRSLFKGLPLAVAEVAPNVALHWALYEHLKTYLRPLLLDNTQTAGSAKNIGNAGNAAVPYLPVILASSISAASALSVTYPLVVIRRNQQVAKKGVGWRAVASKIMASGGARGFYRGLSAQYLQTVPAISISFVVFEFVKGVLRSHTSDDDAQ